MSRTCDAIGCRTDVATGRFMCIKHWRMVPIEVQNTINTRFRACRKDFAFLSDVAYLRAAVDAIDHIARLDGYASEGEGCVANPYRRHLVLALRRSQEPRA